MTILNTKYFKAWAENMTGYVVSMQAEWVGRLLTYALAVEKGTNLPLSAQFAHRFAYSVSNPSTLGWEELR
jgi:hypothetical protein